mmetsp:Transcript_44385/g.132491  ORF Transcript_44385/g.132491 Transcript_44385/m.132491 type:complete len:456 (+) Transcript_44385:484-1851(+)
MAARRQGSLLCREPPGPGRRCPAVRADGGDPRSARKPLAAAGGPWRRYEPWLVGGEVPRVDCRSAAGFREVLGTYVSRHRPVVMENLNVMPAISKWSLEYLREHTTDWPGMNVLHSAGGENRYLYYVPEQADRDMSAFKDAPRQASRDHLMSFSRFLSAAREDPGGRYYLQAPLVLRNADERGAIEETWSKGIDGELRADCDRHVDKTRLEAIGAAGQFGHWSRSQLFVGPTDSLSPVHYDQYDNIYIQVEGEKHFLIFDPRAAEGLYPFPASHPYDEYAMVDLERVDVKTFPRAKEALEGRGAVVTLRPGESLYIPTHWWHHVQGGASQGHWSISVNFWFTIYRLMLEAPHPLPQHLELEMARHAELLLSDVCGSGQVARLAELLRADVDGKDTGLSDVVSLPARNFILHRLARILGADSVRTFVHEHFPAERYERGAVFQALKGPTRGSRERA